MSVNMGSDVCQHAPYCCVTHRLRPYWCQVCNTRALFPEIHPAPSCPLVAHAALSPGAAFVAPVPVTQYHPHHVSSTYYSPVVQASCHGTGQVCTRRRVDTCPDSCPMTYAQPPPQPVVAAPSTLPAAACDIASIPPRCARQ